MAQSVDTKIVELKFNNDNFKDKVESTLKQLDKLNEDIRQVGLNEGFKNISKSAKNVDVSGITNGVEKASKGFSKLEVVGITALANLTNSAVNFGKKLVSNLINPIMQGGLTRAKNLELANFQFKGLGIIGGYDKVMESVTGTAYGYDQAAKAASQFAASNFGVEETTKKLASGAEVAAKVMNDDMRKALLGVAGVAAMTGRDFDDISRVFTKVAGQNKVFADDLNSIASRGLNAKAVLADYYGFVEDGENKVAEKVKAGEVTFKDFANAMFQAYGDHAKEANEMFDGAFSNMKAALARIGADFYTPALKYGRDIANSFSPLIDMIHEVLNPALQKTGNIMEQLSDKARGIFEFLSYAINIDLTKGGSWEWERKNMSSITHLMDMYNKDSKFVYDLIDGFTKYSGTLKGVNQEIKAFDMIADYLEIDVNDVKKGVNEGTIGLYEFYKAFRKLYSQDQALATNKKLAESFDEYIFKAVRCNKVFDDFQKDLHTFHAIVDGTKQILTDLGTVLQSFGRIFIALLGHLKPFGPIIKNIVKEFAQFTVKMADYMAKSKTLNKVIDDIVNAMSRFFQALNVQKWAPAVLTGIGNAFSFIAAMVEKIDEGLRVVVGKINEVFGKLIDRFMQTISNGEELKKILDSFKNAGIIVLAVRMVNMLMKPAEMLETISNAISDTGKSVQGFAKSVGKVFDSIAAMFGKIGGVLDEVRGALQKWQEVLMAATLIEIAIAVIIVAGALYALSKVNAKGVEDNIGPMIELVGIFATLVGVSKFLSKFKETKKLWEESVNDIQSIATAFLEMAAAVAIIAFAMIKLGNMDAKALGRSFMVVEGLLITLALIAKMLAGKETKTTGIKALWEGKVTKSGDMTKGLKGLIAMAFAVKVLVDAMKSLSGAASKEELLVAAGIIEVLMITMAGIAKWLSNNKTEKMTKGLTGLIAMAFAVRLLAKPISDLAMEFAIDPAAVWQAVAVIGIFLAGMGGLAAAFSKTKDKGSALKAALSMLVMAKALTVVSDAILTLSTGDMQSVGIAMFALSVAMYAMVGALALLNKAFDEFGGGAKAILLATSLYILAKAMQVLGETSVFVGDNLDSASKGFYAMAAALGVLYLAALGMKAIPLGAIGKLALVLLEGVAAVAGFGVAIGILGVGLSVFGASLKSLAAGIEAIREFAEELAILTIAIIGLGAIVVGMPEILLALAGLGLVLGIVAVAIDTASNGFEKMAASMSVLVSLDGKFDAVASTIKSFIKAVKDSAKDAEKVGESFGKLADPLTKAAEAFRTISDTVKDIKKNFGDLLGVLTNSLSTIATATTTLSNLKSDALDNAVTAIKNFVNGVKDLKTDASGISEVVDSIASNMERLRNSALDVKNAFETFNQTTATAIQTTATNLMSISNPIAVFTSAKGAITAVKNEMIDFINEISALKDKGPELTASTDAMKTACDNIKPALKTLNDEMGKFHWSLGDVLQHIGEGALNIAKGFTSIVNIKGKLSGVADKISEFMQKLYEATSTMDDVSQHTNKVANAIKKLGTAAKNAVNNLSTKGMASGGEAIAKAIANGIKKSTAVQDAINHLAKKAKSKSAYNGFKSVGQYLVQGMIDGINSKIPALTAAVQKLERLAERAVKAEAKIHSPSRVWMEIGAYMGEGLALGIRNSGDRVAAESESLAATSEDAVRSAIASISSAMDEDMNLNPVITPVVDLTDVDRSARLVSSKFGSVSTGLAGSIGGRVQNGSMANNATLNKLNKTLSSMTESMNSRALNNYITVDGASDPNAFADDLIRSFRLNARTV